MNKNPEKSSLIPEQSGKHPQLGEKAFYNFFYSANAGMSITLPTGEINVNKAYCDMLGYAPEELFNRKWQELTPPNEIESIQKMLDSLIKSNKNHTRFEKRYIHKNGSYIWGDVNIVMIRDAGCNPLCFITTIIDITQHKQAGYNLAISEKRYRRLFETAKDGILILDAETGVIQDVNPFLINLLGISFESFYGKELWELGFFKDIVANKESFLELQEKGYIRYDDLPMKTSNGRSIDVEFVSNVYYEDNQKVIQCNIRDITERKKAEKQIRLLHRAVDSSSVTIFITDPVGNIIYANPFFNELTGYKFDEAIGKNPRFLKSGYQSKEFYKDLWDTILSGKNWEGEFRNKKKNGELYWEKAVISPIINDNNTITNFVAIKEDITEWKQILGDLVEAKEKAEESDRLKTAFLHNISHEIRTPMNAIIGFSALLSEPDLDEASKNNFIEIITRSSNQLLAIINDIIDISNIEAGIVKSAREEIKINDSFQILYDQFSLMAKQKGIVFRKMTPLKDNDAIIVSDNIKILQILSNLLSNAFKFTSAGTIEFGYIPGDKFMDFYVLDTGIGIQRKELPKIFDRFYQADHDMTRLYEGTGLGLSISKALVELLGGSMGVVSEPGKGSKFYFNLPLIKPEKHRVPECPIPLRKSIGREIYVLVAEDDENNSRLIASYLSMPHINVIKVNNGAEAVDYCKSGKPVDLVFMDLKMPVMDGYEATKIIKKYLPELPIIAQTAYPHHAERVKTIKAGCNDFITKPFMKDLILSKIREHLPDLV